MTPANIEATWSWRCAQIYACAGAHVVLFLCAFAPVNAWFVTVLAPIPLVWLALRAQSMRLVLLVTFAAHLVLWLWMGRWLVQITGPGYPGYAAMMSVYAVLLVWAVRRVGQHPVMQHWPMAIVLPVLWTGWEFLRGEVLFDGYPWFFMAHPFIEAPVLVQSADLLGTYFITFLVVMVSGLLVDWLRFRARGMSMRSYRAMAVVVAVVLFCNLGYGYWRMGQQDVLQRGPSMLVIQMNLPQDNKMRSTAEQHWEHFQQFITQTTSAYDQAIAQGEHVDVIVWPETMLQGFGMEPDTLSFFLDNNYWPGFRFAMAMEVLAEQIDTPLLVGSPSFHHVDWRDDQLIWREHYNSAYMVDRRGLRSDDGDLPLGETVYPRYDKLFLTPFGETMPYISNWPWLEQQLLALGASGMRFDLDRGKQPLVLPLHWTQGELALATPICFEATMASVCRQLAYADGNKRADIMVNLTNDGWFGWFAAGRQQHAQIARFRAIENRLPVVRAANTGMSMFIDSTGRVVETIGDGRYGVSQQAGHIRHTVELDRRHTLYGRIGDIFGWVCLVGYLVGLLSSYFFRKDAS